jgi:hypothetical protein
MSRNEKEDVWAGRIRSLAAGSPENHDRDRQRRKVS